MPLFKKKLPHIFLIVSLILLGLIFFHQKTLLRKKYSTWLNNTIDTNQHGLRLFYYGNSHFKGKIEKSTITDNISYSHKNNKNFKRNNFSVRAIGIFNVPEKGRYKFFLKSSDASRLYIDDRIVINNIFNLEKDTTFQMQKTVPLEKGPHLIVIEYFQVLGNAELDFSWLKTTQGQRTHSLKDLFSPAKTSFIWDKDAKQFQNIINYKQRSLIFFKIMLFFIIFIWFLTTFWKFVYFIWAKIYSTRNYPIIRHIIILCPYLAILISGVIGYRVIIFSSGPAIESNDMPVLFYPTYFFVKRAFMSGQIPFWDPHLLFGQPLLLNLGLCLGYFPLIIFLLLSGASDLIPRHLELFNVFHVIFAGVTMYWGLRKVGLKKPGACLGGIVFQLFVGNKEQIVWPSMVYGIPWVPLAVFYFFACLAQDTSKNIKWHKVRDSAILIISCFMLISITHPHLLAYTYFQSFLTALCFFIYHLTKRNFRQAAACIKRSIFYPTAPVFLAGFLLIPILSYLPNTTRFISAPCGIGLGPLYKSYFLTIFIPIITHFFSAPYAYTGILTILLALGYCIFTAKQDRFKYDFFWIIFAIFWILFSIENSPLYPFVLKYIPLMQSMRFSQRGMIFYTLSAALLAGRFLNILCYSEKRIIFHKSAFLVFPVFLATMILFTINPFINVIHQYPIKIDFRIIVLLISITTLIVSVILHDRTKAPMFRSPIKFILPLWLIIELVSICDLPYLHSSFPPYHPYDGIWKAYNEKYPEIYNDKPMLHRIEKYSEHLILPYYFDKYSTGGYLSQATHPWRYYYLWNNHGGWFGYGYKRFWDLSYLPISSPIYDLTGVKYFIMDKGTDADPLPREKRGCGEWIEGILEKPQQISKIRIFNTDNNRHRRITKGHFDLNEKTVLSFDMPLSSGWHEFTFKPVLADKFKLTIDEAKYQRWDGTDGVMIGELELYNTEGIKINIEDWDITVSSTNQKSRIKYLVDNDPEMPWESGCRITLKEMMETDSEIELRENLFINKNVLPRAFIVRDTKVFKNIGELTEELHKSDFTPSKTLFLEEEPIKNIKQTENKNNDKIEISDYKLNRVDIKAVLESPGYLVLTDTYLPGWSVHVNGKKENIHRAYGYFRAVFLEKGHNKITFKYFPPMLIQGIIVSLLTLIGLITIGIFSMKNTKKQLKQNT